MCFVGGALLESHTKAAARSQSCAERLQRFPSELKLVPVNMKTVRDTKAGGQQDVFPPAVITYYIFSNLTLTPFIVCFFF